MHNRKCYLGDCKTDRLFKGSLSGPWNFVWNCTHPHSCVKWFKTSEPLGFVCVMVCAVAFIAPAKARVALKRNSSLPKYLQSARPPLPLGLLAAHVRKFCLLVLRRPWWGSVEWRLASRWAGRSVEVTGPSWSRDCVAVRRVGHTAAHRWQLSFCKGLNYGHCQCCGICASWFSSCLSSSSHLEFFFTAHRTAEVDIFPFNCSKTRTAKRGSVTVLRRTVQRRRTRLSRCAAVTTVRPKPKPCAR